MNTPTRGPVARRSRPSGAAPAALLLAAAAVAPGAPAAPPAATPAATATPAAATPTAPAAATPAAQRPAAPATAATVARVTDADVRAFMARLERAARARDVAALAAALADDARIELRTQIDGRDQLTQFTKAEYVAMLEGGYAAMRDLTRYDYRVLELEIAIEPGGGAAAVRAQVEETALFHGRESVTLSDERSRLERRGGSLALVTVEATTVAAPR